jgi:hypothetical protein
MEAAKCEVGDLIEILNMGRDVPLGSTQWVAQLPVEIGPPTAKVTSVQGAIVA